jgi:hypothetical protein
MYHRTLERQIKKFIGAQPIPKSLLPFLRAISDTYAHADEDQKLLERSIDISSREMSESNTQLRQEKKYLEDRTAQLEITNNVMVGREMKMIELKKTVAELDAKLNNKSISSKTPRSKKS